MNSLSKEANKQFDVALKLMHRCKWREALEAAREIHHRRMRECAVDLIIFRWADQRQVPKVPESELNHPQNESAKHCFRALTYIIDNEDEAAHLVIEKIKDRALRIKIRKELL